tara:strand:- start:1091 stop:1276 length:186 start_codon:yes stop_codon:yes gene_type:complete
MTKPSKTAMEKNIINMKRLKLVTCILLKPHEKIIVEIITIISQWLGKPRKIFFMREPLIQN